MSEPIKLPPIPREWDHNGLHTWERIFTASVTQQYARLAVEQNTAALRAECDALRAALQIAIRQNEHDMLMTGDELRAARAALKEEQ